MAYEVAHHGDENTTDYRCFITKGGDVVSPLHDIPLWADKEKGICNMIVEIPRGTNAKLEITLDEEGNAIKQDVKKGKLRLVDDVYPYIGYIWNYGAFPQTWENPNFTHPETEAKGDNDPLDVCDIGQATGYRGQVKQVKVLGTLALIDEGETDWKVITIDVTDPRAADFNDISDVEKAMPGFTMATYEWFRTYKMPAGKPPNVFAFNGAAKDRAYALSIIEENYQFWSELLAGKIENSGLCLKNRVVEGAHKVDKYAIADFAPRVLSTAVQNTFVTPEHPVAAHVTAEQRAKYFSVASLSSALAAIADSLGKENATALLQANEHIGAVINAGKAAAGEGYWTVAFNAAGTVFGLYQKAGPHALKFDGSEAVASAGYDLVAAGAKGADGSFSYNAGYGMFTFNPALQAAAAASPVAAGGDLLGETAPLAFLAAF